MSKTTILFNAINALSAGTSSVTRTMVDQLADSSEAGKFVFLVPKRSGYDFGKSRGGVKIHYVDIPVGWKGALARIRFELFTLPRLADKVNATTIVVLGNYSLRRSTRDKVVLVRHPYLLEISDIRQSRLPFKRKVEECIRRYLFKVTVNTTDRWITQSEEMKSILGNRWAIDPSSITVIPNPVDCEVLLQRETNVRSTKIPDDWQLIYPSRWYEHKNHSLLVNYVRADQDFLRAKKIKFIITIEPCTATLPLLQSIKDAGAADLVCNFGELPREKLYELYRSCHAVIFPSESETFGNGLIEGACFGLPVIVADRPYGHAIGQDDAIYFEPSSIPSWHEAIELLITDFADTLDRASRIAWRTGINTNEWVRRATENRIVVDNRGRS